MASVLQPLAPASDGRFLPHPSQLAALGTVLCLYRPSLGSELDGWARTAAMGVQQCVDSDGLRESLWFFDRGGQCCWRLYLLPDSDFLAWDRLVSRTPVLPEAGSEAGIGERLWRRLAGRVRGESWRMSVVRLHATGDIGTELAASLASASAVGTNVLRRIARDEGLDLSCASHDCCCARSGRKQEHGGGEAPLVRL